MQENKSILNYFLQGFRLLNKNIEIFIINILLLLISTFLPTINLPSELTLITAIISLTLSLLIISYGLSIPLLFTYKQQGGIIDFSYLRKILPQNLKRLFESQTTAKSFLISFLILVTAIFAFLILKPDVKSITDGISNLNKTWDLRFTVYTSVLAILQSFLVFSSIFFSINNLRIYSALKNSIAYSFHNLKFVGVVAGLYVASNLIFIFINLLPLESILLNALGYAASLYIGSVATASALIYYQKTNK